MYLHFEAPHHVVELLGQLAERVRAQADLLAAGKDFTGRLGDFGDVRIVSEGKLWEADAALKRPDLLEMTEKLGRKLVEEFDR